MVNNRKSSWLRKWLIGLAVLTVIAAGAFFWYVNDYYQATTDAVEALQSDESVTITETDDAITFAPNGEDPEEGVIFYPGGKVEAEAYAPLLRRLAEADLLVVIVKMPFHLAVFDADAAEAIMAQENGVEDWYLAGHSLGGVMASSFAADQSDEVAGLIFLASYPSGDLIDVPFPVLSIYGSEDEVLNRESYDEAQGKLPDDYTEIVLAGGNHGQFGDYGSQSGDGTATISTVQQQKQTVEAITAFIENSHQQ
ncbi:alpha/beta hydrolase [Trichococcus pasteurii]|uniref:Alpha/beta hydrolase fold-5 n=1 Tax=Trichococcus pasteurii TaxID=43064 RepID=A0A1W1IHJ6_9LACT|nr:alpha/beta hydrolase [Trichococcus pasteurii]SFE53930.1 Alpha/beta hydrolase family protein [Trichococcus pasteurii]SLM52379.1 alpha/beta hydrolase fold-5 [Trichococcus pasteurii]SSB93260.1 alpha/beta hydrolase fold-5 [Trichococcus pasteurii]